MTRHRCTHAPVYRYRHKERRPNGEWRYIERCSMCGKDLHATDWQPPDYVEWMQKRKGKRHG